MLELIINNNQNLEDIILLQNGKIIEHYTSNEDDKLRRIEGNIYVGQVKDIVSGMQSAFIDFGKNRKGFIHLKDAMPQLDEAKEQIDNTIDIKQVLKPNQKLLIQIKKDNDDTKGARVSTHISLPGKYIVLMPKTSFITISQKIEDKSKKEALLKYCKENLPKNFGAVIRTAAEKASNEQIINDINELLKTWKSIENKFKNSQNTPALLFESKSIAEKIIIDLGKNKLDKIITNDKKEYDKLINLCNGEKLNLFLEEEDLIKKYDLNSQIEKIENRKIWLDCGGFITIDKTEALTAIDVNTGKFTGKKDVESTVFRVNKEATTEIAKQLRLRDIGGIIIIDYIDMHDEENKKKIEELLIEELKTDRAKTQVEGFTKLNLMELTRKHICSHLNNQ